MNRSEFAQVLQRAVVAAMSHFREQVPEETPYALAIILGQVGNYLGFAVATEEGLLKVASEYATAGYRYQAWKSVEFAGLERLAHWIRWANPDDGWKYGDFPEHFGIAPLLSNLVEGGVFGEDAEELEEFCTEVLAKLQSDADWLSVTGGCVVVGVTFGTDPRDFLRTATRANRYEMVCQLWAEHFRGEELCRSILPPG